MAIIAELLARKAVTRELGSGPLPQPIGILIDAEFAIARDHWPQEPWRADPAAVAAPICFGAGRRVDMLP